MLPLLIKRAIELYATRVPYHPGKWRIIEAAVRHSGIEADDAGKTFEVRRHGVRWRLRTECAVQRRLYYHGELDIYDTAAFLEHIPADGVFFDIGSYFGYYSMLAAKRGARVYAFEPMPDNFAMLTGHCDLNGFSNVTASTFALSDREGAESFLLPDDDNRGTGSIRPEGAVGGRTVDVRTTTLDQFTAEHGIERLDALKLDVEGAELRVLAGARETLRRFRPAMLVELNPPCLARFGASEQELLECIRGLGYSVLHAERTGLHEYAGIPAGLEYINVLCLPKER